MTKEPMLKQSLEDIFEAFDNVDADGVLTFQMPAKYLPSDLPKSRIDIARELISSFFYDQQLVIVKFDLVKKFIKDILVNADKDEAGSWTIKINFAKLLMLPSVSPHSELSELRKFFEEAKVFMEADPTQVSTIQISNERDAHSRVYGSLTCHRRNSMQVSSKDLEFKARLDTLVEDSPVIKNYLREVALALGKMGPYSWANVTERTLYPYGSGPWSDWFVQEHGRTHAKSED